jgi:hypothetical protein
VCGLPWRIVSARRVTVTPSGMLNTAGGRFGLRIGLHDGPRLRHYPGW